MHRDSNLQRLPTKSASSGGPCARSNGALPPVLEVLLNALAAGRGPCGNGKPSRHVDRVPFKNAGYLAAVLGASEGRLVTRRAVVRYISALRARLNNDGVGRGLTIETDRWLGWRIVGCPGSRHVAPRMSSSALEVARLVLKQRATARH